MSESKKSRSRSGQQNRRPGRSGGPSSNKRGRSQPKRRPQGDRGRRGQQNRKRDNQRPFKQQAIHLPKTYDVLFYKTLREAEADQPRIRAKSGHVDQLNVVVEAEDLTEEFAFSDVAELYCGAAWTLIHRRRVEDNWYADRQPAKAEVDPAAGEQAPLEDVRLEDDHKNDDDHHDRRDFVE